MESASSSQKRRLFLHIIGCKCSSAEQQADAPDSSQADQRVNNTADDTRLAAEDPRHKVKLKNSDKTPVQ